MTPEEAAIAATRLQEAGYRRRHLPRLAHCWSKPDGTRAFAADLYRFLVTTRPSLRHLVPRGMAYSDVVLISRAADNQAIPARP